MRYFLSFFLSFLTSFAVYAQKPQVLVTAFTPFGMHKINSTIEIASRIKEKLGQKEINVKVCVLPVIYDKAAVEAKNCYEQMNPKPDLVVSLGASACQIKIESMAHNIDNSAVRMQDNVLVGEIDNSGVWRTNQVIIPGGESPLSFGSFVSDMYCSQSEKIREHFDVSTTPGGFVCNNTAYLLGDYFRNKKVRFTFIHVPGDGCNTLRRDGVIEKNVNKKVAAIISEMISKLPLFSQQEISFEQVFPYLPRSGNEIKSAQEKLISLPKSDLQKCGLEYLEKMSKTLN